MTAHILGSNGTHPIQSPPAQQEAIPNKVDQAAQTEFKQAQAEAAARREFFIKDIMQTKQVSYEAAAAEYDFFS